MSKPNILARLADIRFVRFVVVGMGNAAFGYACIWLFMALGFDYRLALLFGTIAGVLFNFKTTGKLVFKSSDNRLILRFLIVYACIYGTNVAIVRIFLLLGLSEQLGAALAVVPLAVLGYILNRRFVFRAPVVPTPD